jgi:ABC-type bacteriocin/lantibiotic exporter with double-glycine peptidase domain
MYFANNLIHCMETGTFIPLLEKLSELLQSDIKSLQLKNAVQQLDNKKDSVEGYLKALTECASAANLSFITQEFTDNEFKSVLKNLSFPLVVFSSFPEVCPVVLFDDEKAFKAWRFTNNECIEIEEKDLDVVLLNLLSFQAFTILYNNPLANFPKEEAVIFTLAPLELDSMFGSDVVEDLSDDKVDFTPVKRFWKFVTSEKKNIFYIYIYALIIGIINLSLPLGVQAIIGRISGGLLFDGVVVLIVFVILGLLIVGALQILQIYLVEILQRRIFTKAAFEFAFRIPRIKTEALKKIYAPELINRFFDVITLQKGFSKVLLDLTTAILQIAFGLILLSLYHSSFIIFGLILLIVVVFIFKFTGPKGLTTSLKESKYKYSLVAWLEELARTRNTFKLAGYTTMPMDRTDKLVDSYLSARKAHFKVLLNQFVTITIFKLLVTGGTLIIGCLLVVSREITLGQFVASEIVIILIMGAVEKIILNMDTIYDVLTAVEKVAQLTDLPLQKNSGINISHKSTELGISLRIDSLKFKFDDSQHEILKNVTFEVKPAENVCIVGASGSGKSTLCSIISGIQTDYSGTISLNGIPYKNIRNSDLHEIVNGNLIQEEIFGGSIDDNIRLGNPSIRHQNVLESLQRAGLTELINRLPEGIFSDVLPGGQGLSSSERRKLQLARCLATNPRLFLWSDMFDGLELEEKKRIINEVFIKNSNNSVLAFSNDPIIMKSCDRVLLLADGIIAAEGNFETISKHPLFVHTQL